MKMQAKDIEAILKGGELAFSYDIEVTPAELNRLGVAAADDSRAQAIAAGEVFGLELVRFDVEQDNAHGCCKVQLGYRPKATAPVGAIEPPTAEAAEEKSADADKSGAEKSEGLKGSKKPKR